MYTFQHVHLSTRTPINTYTFNTYTFQHVHLSTCTPSTPKPFNAYTLQHVHLQHVHLSTRTPFNLYTFQHVHISTRTPFNTYTFNTYTFQHVHLQHVHLSTRTPSTHTPFNTYTFNTYTFNTYTFQRLNLSTPKPFNMYSLPFAEISKTLCNRIDVRIPKLYVHCHNTKYIVTTNSQLFQSNTIENGKMHSKNGCYFISSAKIVCKNKCIRSIDSFDSSKIKLQGDKSEI